MTLIHTSRPYFSASFAQRLATLAGGLAASLCLMTGTTQAANCTAPIVDGALYTITNVGTGKVLDIVGGSVQPGAYVQQWGSAGSTNQQFTVRSTGSGYWTIQGRQSGLPLDVLNLALTDGAKIIQWTATGAQNQQWLLKKSTTGGYNVVARHSNKSLTVADANSGSYVYQATDTASGNQRWFFNPVSVACGGAPDGFASQAGTDGLSTTTGGGSATPVVVTSCSAMVTALKSTSAAVIHIPAGTTIDCRTAARAQNACAVACPSYQDPGKYTYRIPVGAQTCTELGSTSNALFSRSRNETTVTVASNKTLLGLGPDSAIVGASLNLSNAKNIIIRNLSLENVNPGLVEAGDGMTLSNSSHIWIDHVRFSLISDGHIDITNSNNVTLSWNRFDGTNPAVCASQHWYTNLVSNSRVTLHHNFWNKAGGRNPKLDGAATRAHLYNNYWLDITYFAINASDYAQGKVEGNYFANSAKPHWDAGNGLFNAPLASNRYTGVSATDAYRNTGATVFSDLVLYPYTLDAVDSIPALLTSGTGPR
jgi:pectate lyase